MLDFTNSAAKAWFKEILRGIADDGINGLMADSGEGLPLHARLHTGKDPAAAVYRASRSTTATPAATHARREQAQIQRPSPQVLPSVLS